MKKKYFTLPILYYTNFVENKFPRVKISIGISGINLYVWNRWNFIDSEGAIVDPIFQLLKFYNSEYIGVVGILFFNKSDSVKLYFYSYTFPLHSLLGRYMLVAKKSTLYRPLCL